MAPKAKASPSKKAAKAEKPAKKEKKEKDPNAPKRPLSAYMFFASDKRKELKETQPGLSLGEVGKATGEAWKELTDKEKEPYVKKAEADKARYEKEKAKYEAKNASRPAHARTLLAFDAKAGMAGIGMAGGYGVNGANVMQGVMARVNSAQGGATFAAPAAVRAALAAVPDVTIPGAAGPDVAATPSVFTASVARLAGRKRKL
ncbi:non-histone chromosomal 6 [Chlorella sorokiniana]|uniref:Non-histone chromosomal 6 n=1 Tax=Chlorella sorokiniana TaxID=3076 RepID=A0A2P6TJ21_CHLSO|nr:non-histone chromosomal 6 [Chlorella sorokiniana]|eukprot:PRW39212.1 non-histone chromosomal 6 [Chlorella sorokiniana]